MEHPDCDWKIAHKRLMRKVMKQLDLTEETVESGEMPSVALHKMIKKLIQDEGKRTSVKKEENPKKVKVSEKDSGSGSDLDSDIEIIEMEVVEISEDDDSSSTEKSSPKKRTTNSTETEEQEEEEKEAEESHKKLKSTHTQTDSAPEPKQNEQGQEKENHNENDNNNEEEEVQELHEQITLDQDEEEEEILEIAEIEVPAQSKNNSNENPQNSEDPDFFTPIYCPIVSASFWTKPMTPAEKTLRGTQKLAIHNYPQKLGEENYPNYQTRFGNDLWFLVSSYSEFIYYKIDKLTVKLKSMRATELQLWLQIQISDFQNEQLGSFLSEFGKFITHFTFERLNRQNEVDQISQQQLLALLFDKLYNVEYLVLSEQHIDISTSNRFSNGEQEKKLLNLKTIQFINTKFSFSSDFIESILKSSPNLKFIHNLPLKFVKLIISLDKTSCVKSVEMDHSDSYERKQEFEQDLENLALSKIPLEKLVLPVYFNEPNGDQTVASINYHKFFSSKSLSSSSSVFKIHNSLKELHVEPVKPLDWSKFGELKELHTLRINIYGFVPHFPNSNELDINTVFPKVKTLIIDHWMSKKTNNDNNNGDNSISSLSPPIFFKKYFPRKIFIPRESFKSVRELKLMNSFPVECMKNMRVLLPRISILSWTCTLSKFHQILPLCWSLWTGLKTLRFELDLGERIDDPGSDFEYADSALLGLPEAICQELRDGIEIENDQESDEFDKTRSIFNLKQLTRFKIEIQEPSCSDESAETRIFSGISGSHGFAKMKQKINPKFKAQISFHSGCSSTYVKSVRRSLKPLLKFVNH